MFLDKDGTLVDDVPYNVDPSLIRLAPGARSALRRLGALQVPLVVVTNQPGVALGLFELDALDAVEAGLAQLFERCGARLDGFYACPHHPAGTVATYTCDCLCRKPMPGLLQRAAADLSFDPARSWMVGDILDDIEAGNRFGCRTILVDNGNETEWLRSTDDLLLRTPDHVVADVDAAARIIEEAFGGEGTARVAGPPVGASRPA